MNRSAEKGVVALELALFLPMLCALMLVEASFGLMLYRTAIALERLHTATRYLARAPWNDSLSESVARCLIVTGEVPNADSSCPSQDGLPGLDPNSIVVSFNPVFVSTVGVPAVAVVTVSLELPLDDVSFGLSGVFDPTLTLTYPWAGA